MLCPSIVGRAGGNLETPNGFEAEFDGSARERRGDAQRDVG